MGRGSKELLGKERRRIFFFFGFGYVMVFMYISMYLYTRIPYLSALQRMSQSVRARVCIGFALHTG